MEGGLKPSLRNPASIKGVLDRYQHATRTSLSTEQDEEMQRTLSHHKAVNPNLRTEITLPVPRPGQVLALLGTNGIAKSTSLKILCGKLKPNLGQFKVHIQYLLHK
ncbi:ABC transporter E family member 2 [Hordeum vulgare]|nr:ABC transporter E family member 2 [Hordeum vulgare]